MQQIQENLFVILSLLIFGSAAFILFKRFGKPDQSQNQIINSDEVFSELSKSKEEAAKFTALAQERKFEVEQLKRELSDLRERIDEQKVEIVWLHNGLTHELFEQDLKSMVSSGGPGSGILYNPAEKAA